MMRKDKQATMDKQYLDPGSYVTPDGREILKGEDWKARVEDLRLRCGGQCEAQMFSEYHEFSWRCTSRAQDPHHIIRRSVKRDDRLANLQALCRFHHDLLDRRKPRWGKKEKAHANR